MTEEQKIFAGKLYSPADPALKAIKLRTHNLSTRYNQTLEDETELRSGILADIFGDGLGEGSFFQGPIYIHYGCHTKIGKRLFANFNLTIQDDTHVTIGDNCNFGPNVTIVTPIHPLLPEERNAVTMPDGSQQHVCYAKPVHIGSNCWLGAGVTVCPGVTIGDNCVIGAGSVVTRDIPAGSLAAGVPCKTIRGITEADSLRHIPGLLEGEQAGAGPAVVQSKQAAQGEGPIPLGLYRHYKGNQYEVIGFATHSETLETMVVYKALYGERGTWVRPLSMWENLIEVEGKSVKRVAYIGPQNGA